MLTSSSTPVNPLGLTLEILPAAQDFLSGLAGYADAGHLALWTLAGKRSTWLPLPLTPPADLPQADLYVGVATSAHDLGPKQRVKAADAHSLLALVADIDIAHPLHSKAAQLPQTEAEALQILADTNLPPTALVHSGHGLQAWWCLKEQWLLDSDAEREAAMDLAADWGATVAEHARRRGRTVDSVYDLARLMRVPGTINAKDKQHPVPVELREADWSRRYNPDDFRDLLLLPSAKKASIVTGQKRTADAAGAHLAQAAALPADKLAALCENSDTFRQAWDGARDYPSQSERDLALAGIMLEANFTPAEVRAVLYESRRKHGDNPQKALRQDYLQRTLAKAREGRQAEPVADLGDDLRQALGALPATDAGNAEALAVVHGADLRFDATPGRERWLRFLGHLWEPADRGHLKALALNAVRTRRRVADGNSDLQKFCAGSESRARISALLDLAESRPPIYSVTLAGQVPVWDRDRDLLGASNGIIDLTSGQLRPGEREDYITRRLAVPYSRTAPARRWLQFLQEVFGSDDLTSYVQKAVGYSLFGTVSEQVFFLCIGPGANGKTQFLSALRNVLGNYGHAAPFSLFDHNERGQHPQALAQLEGRRFVTASESAEGCRLNEDRLKSLAGGEPITAHLMRENDRTFENTAAIWLGVNNFPRVVDESEGFWRKARVIPFTRCFKPQEIIDADADLQENPGVLPIDPDLAETLAEEQAGILRWTVEGAVAWHREGLSTPAQVRDASGRWRDSASELGEFFATRCVLGHRATVGAGELYAEYCEWALAEGIGATDRLSQSAFGARLAARFDKARRRDGDGNRIVIYTGVGLRKA